MPTTARDFTPARDGGKLHPAQLNISLGIGTRSQFLPLDLSRRTEPSATNFTNATGAFVQTPPPAGDFSRSSFWKLVA
jgi:hypothetical protein